MANLNPLANVVPSSLIYFLFIYLYFIYKNWQSFKNMINAVQLLYLAMQIRILHAS